MTMEGTTEKDCSPLWNLYQQIVSDMKVGHVWRAFLCGRHAMLDNMDRSYVPHSLGNRPGKLLVLNVRYLPLR